MVDNWPGAGASKRKDQPTAGWALQVAGRSMGGSHVANMCNAVVLGAVRRHSPGVVTGDAPAPASCMELLSGCAQMLAQLSEPSGDP